VQASKAEALGPHRSQDCRIRSCVRDPIVRSQHRFAARSPALVRFAELREFIYQRTVNPTLHYFLLQDLQRFVAAQRRSVRTVGNQRVISVSNLAAAALDVFWEEPISPVDPLLALPNLIATPHVAGVADRSYAQIAEAVTANIERLRCGQPLLNRVA
jgi:D-isomer specific 2-hydroxyacid dehydrogenase, NAD binding domain